MQTIKVQWHRTPFTSSVTVPEPELRTLFATVGVDLQISRGEDIGFSPKTEAHFDLLEERFRPKGSGAMVGHLFLSDTPYSNRTGVLGEVCGRTHGIAVVYVDRLGTDAVKDSLLSVCAHELGHMCNLTHNLADESPFDSVMMQSKSRDEPAPAAWAAAKSEAASTGIPEGIFTNVGLNCLPFNHACRKKLAAPSANWGPWTGFFSGGGLGEREDVKKKTPALQMLLHSARSECDVNDPIAFDIELVNKSRKRSITVPLNLECEFGHLEVTVMSGTIRRVYAPRTFSCCHDLHTITPGNSFFFPVSLTAGRFGSLIEAPGTHRIRVELTTGKAKNATSVWGEFDLTVKEPATSTAQLSIAPRAVVHATILAQAASMSAPALNSFIKKIARQYPAPEDTALHLHLRKRAELYERRQ